MLAKTQTGLHNYVPVFSSTACASAQTSYLSYTWGQEIGGGEHSSQSGVLGFLLPTGRCAVILCLSIER